MFRESTHNPAPVVLVVIFLEITYEASTARNTAKYMLAVLFAEKFGCYADLSFVDLWSKERDARNYDGNMPVIAHPPCQLWGALANVNFSRWGGEHNRPGNDGGCFEFSLDAVRRCGGVLEHPAGSQAFVKFGIKPNGMKWQQLLDRGWVCEVWQSAYGHRARKSTWLYYVGDNPPTKLKWDRKPGSHQVGSWDQRGKARNKPTLSKKEANATPIDFRNELVVLALNSMAACNYA